MARIDWGLRPTLQLWHPSRMVAVFFALAVCAQVTAPSETAAPSSSAPSASASAASSAVTALVRERRVAEEDHLKRLGLWAGANVVAGAGLLLLARPETSPLPAPPTMLEGFAVQSLAWGAINGTIVALGLLLPAPLPETRDEALAAEDDLAKVLWVNVGLDAGYAMAGGTMIAAGAFGAAPDEQWQSHGVGIIMQGVGLGFLDVIAAWESGPREEALQALPAEAPASGRTPGTLR